ncbi:MAG: acyl-phosphate glycerol 3-phosphate acyltransferase [Actinobacteria bacterium RBG_16_70_17]|nr:MAG: acyl-phosphate glycerol 3-phosphate acyltransferase [Actinobacteria bacterium RBG_16_70_17]
MDAWDVAAIVAGYLLGSIDFGVIVPRMFGIDIYGSGSGNPGATNVLRTVGRREAALVLLGDLAKGAAAAALGNWAGGEVIGFAAGLAAVVGHCFPLWHRFRGGKGVSAAGGMVLFLEPFAGLILLGAFVAVVALTRKGSLGSLTAAVGLLPALAVFGHRGWSLGLAGAAVALIVIRHVPNIRRLLGGREHAIEQEAEQG